MSAHVEKECRKMTNQPRGRYTKDKTAGPEIEDCFDPETEVK